MNVDAIPVNAVLIPVNVDVIQVNAVLIQMNVDVILVIAVSNVTEIAYVVTEIAYEVKEIAYVLMIMIFAVVAGKIDWPGRPVADGRRSGKLWQGGRVIRDGEVDHWRGRVASPLGHRKQLAVVSPTDPQLLAQYQCRYLIMVVVREGCLQRQGRCCQAPQHERKRCVLVVEVVCAAFGPSFLNVNPSCLAKPQPVSAIRIDVV